MGQPKMIKSSLGEKQMCNTSTCGGVTCGAGMLSLTLPFRMRSELNSLCRQSYGVAKILPCLSSIRLSIGRATVSECL